MKIGIDARNLEGRRTGVGRYLVSVLKEWNRFDLSRRQAGLPTGLKFILYFKKQIPDLDLSERFERKLLDSDSHAFFTHWLLPMAAKKDGVDVLFCPNYIAPIFYPSKIALTLHDIIYQARPDLYNWPSVWDRILLKKFSEISAKKAQVIFVPSEFSRKEVIKHYQIGQEKIIVTPEAADDSFRPMRNKGNSKKFILSIGSIFNRRHLPEVISAFDRVSRKLADYQFLIVGANHTNPFIDIQQMIKGKAISRKDYYDGSLPELYNAADLTIYLSDYEGFGLPVLESMACATPVITSRKASLPEVAGEAAIYVEDNTNVDEIEKAIYRGLTDNQLRGDLIQKGLDQAEKFSWRRCAQTTLDALLSIG